MARIDIFQDWIQWRAFVNTEMGILYAIKVSTEFLDWRKNCQLFKYEPIPRNNSGGFLRFGCRLWGDKMNANSFCVVS